MSDTSWKGEKFDDVVLTIGLRNLLDEIERTLLDLGRVPMYKQQTAFPHCGEGQTFYR